MTSPAAPAGIQRFGPGSFKLGETGSLKVASSLINGLRIKPDTTTADSKTKLSGYVRGGSSKSVWTLTGNIDTDAAAAGGIWDLCFTTAGEEVDFEFVPETATGVKVTGTVIVTPLGLGGDEFGDDLAEDFEWTIVGTPDVTRAP